MGLGGYLLQGGYGWNGRVHGPACMSVEAIDVVLADGSFGARKRRENAELLWAARGAGPGFFGVVTRFHLRLVAQPKLVVNSVFLYPMDVLERGVSLGREIGPKVARDDGADGLHPPHRRRGARDRRDRTGAWPTASRRPREAVAVLESCPVLDRAKLALPYVPGTLADLYAGAHAAYPDGHRYSADNMWTHAPVEELAAGSASHRRDDAPGAVAHAVDELATRRHPRPERPDMAYSVEDDTYIALYGVWQDPAEDEANVAWATERMREIEPHATGIQLADENLGNRPARFLSEESWARLEGCAPSMTLRAASTRGWAHPERHHEPALPGKAGAVAMSPDSLSRLPGAPDESPRIGVLEAIEPARSMPMRHSHWRTRTVCSTRRLLSRETGWCILARRRRLCGRAHRHAQCERRDGGLVV